MDTANSGLNMEIHVRNVLITFGLLLTAACAQKPIDGRSTDLRDSNASIEVLRQNVELRENIIFSCRTFGTSRINEDKPACVNAFKVRSEEQAKQREQSTREMNERLRAAAEAMKNK